MPEATTFFSQAQLARIVQETLPPVSDDHTIAVVGTVDNDGAQVVANFTRRTGTGDWTLQAAYRHDWAGDVRIGAHVMWSR